MDVAENIENFDDDVTELGDLLYHEELQYRKYKIRTSTFSTLAFRRTMSREPTYPCYIFLFYNAYNFQQNTFIPLSI